MVIKRDGARQPFDREKIVRGLQQACGKRPIPENEKRRLIEEIEEALYRDFDKEVESAEIGRRLASRLRDIDEIAYIRFASEYEKFTSVSDIMDTIEQLSQRVRDVKDQQRLFDG